MTMSRSASTVIWSIVGAVVAAVAIFAAVLGPRLYREGRAMVEPIMEMASSEKELAALSRNIPWEAPSDGVVGEDRFQVFLDIRRQLQAPYRAWDEVVRAVERQGESWEGAKDILSDTRDVMRQQIDALRQHRMSPDEFRFLELAVYDGWLDQLDAHQVPGDTRGLREATDEDLAFVAELAGRHGRSPALTAIEQRLEDRRATLEGLQPPVVDGTPAANAALFWQHRDEIAELDLRTHELHTTLRQAEWQGVNVQVGDRTRVSVDAELESTE
jgi:hypothetical protein